MLLCYRTYPINFGEGISQIHFLFWILWSVKKQNNLVETLVLWHCAVYNEHTSLHRMCECIAHPDVFLVDCWKQGRKAMYYETWYGWTWFFSSTRRDRIFSDIDTISAFDFLVKTVVGWMYNHYVYVVKVRIYRWYCFFCRSFILPLSLWDCRIPCLVQHGRSCIRSFRFLCPMQVWFRSSLHVARSYPAWPVTGWQKGLGQVWSQQWDINIISFTNII